MQETIQRIFGQLLDKWKALERKNKALIILVTIVVAAAITVTVLMLTAPNMVPALSGLTPKATTEASEALTAAGIKHDISNDLTSVLVPSKQLVQAKTVLVTEGIPSDGFNFADAIGNISMGTTAETQKMIESELTKSRLEEELTTWGNIKKATVTLTMKDADTLFRTQSQKPTASISLETTGDFTKSTAKSVANYVKGSISGLELANIFVTNNNGVELFNGEKEQNAVSGVDLEFEQQKIAQIKNDVVPHFKMYEDVEVSVYLKTNSEYVKEETEEYTAPIEDSDRGLISAQTRREQTVQNGEIGDEPGQVVNGGDVPEYQIGGELPSLAESNETDTDYELNKKTTQVEKLPGAIDTESASLALTFYQVKTYYEESAERAGLLADKSWDEYQDDIKSQIVPLVMDNTVRQDIINTAISATGIENVTVAAYELPMFRKKEVAEVPIGSYAAVLLLIALIALLALGLIRRTEPEEITEFEPELSVEELLVSTQQEPESADSIAGIDYMVDSELKKQIDKFVDEKPEAVAQLLRNWLSDEWE